MTELMAVAGRKDRTKFRNQVLRPLLDAGWIEMTIPDKPTSRMQRYRITAAGREVLAAVEGGRGVGTIPDARAFRPGGIASGEIATKRLAR